MSALLDEAVITDDDARVFAGLGSSSTNGRRVYAVEIIPDDMRAVRWLEDGRIPLGGLSLLAGREGVGKSIFWAHLAAQITKGTLPGHWYGQPKSVLVAATEDSWAPTITPRLVASGADLTRILRIEVRGLSIDYDTNLNLPSDLAGLESVILQRDVALVVFDPLGSRLASNLDTHKDAEVRRALEPLSATADRTGATILGLIHVNKTATTDPLTSLMGSRAFPAVARAVVYMAYDEADENVRLVGTPKNNVGPTDSTTRTCRIESVKVGIDPNGLDIWTGRLIVTGIREESIRDALEASVGSTSESRSNSVEAADWVHAWLEARGGSAPSSVAKAEGSKEGHLSTTLTHSLHRAGVRIERPGYQKGTVWTLSPFESVPGEGDLDDLDGRHSGHSGQLGKHPTRATESDSPPGEEPTAFDPSDVF
jgi:hypothetical protein